jgi:hypothetical protein
MANKKVKKGFERKEKKNGKENPAYVDVLKQDDPLAGQAWGCFSFISPETILAKKELFFFQEFVKQWDMNKSMEKFFQFLNFVSYKYKIRFEEIQSDFETFVKEEKASIVGGISDDYKNFMDREEDKLQEQFDIEHEFQTNIRGFKSRGNFSTKEEATLRAHLLREKDPFFDVFVGQVGVWMPWDPEAYKTGDVQYMEEELNQLHHEKNKNDQLAKAAFEKRVAETKQNAIEDNKKNTEKFGNTVTQDIDKEGNLIGVGVTSIEQFFADKPAEDITASDIRSELFDGENIVVGKTDYGQSQLISGPFATKNA